MSSIEQVSF